MSGGPPVKVTRTDLIESYYIEELGIREMASGLGCDEETVRRQCRRHHLPPRDRDWPEGEIFEAARGMVETCGGLSMNGDMSTIARALLRRKSAVVDALAEQWLRIFAPNVDVEVCPLRRRCMSRGTKDTKTMDKNQI